MTAHADWQDIALRLLAAVIAGGLIGHDRGARGRMAGLRTTMLLCLAAAGAMIEADLLLETTGKSPSSFAVADVLRFPLGILSGIGFIGAGAIVRRGRLVTGVTTAATMWLVTVIGLVIGGGFLGLGASLTAVAMAVLAALKKVETRIRRERHAALHLRLDKDMPTIAAVRSVLTHARYDSKALSIRYEDLRDVECNVQWTSAEDPGEPPAFVAELKKMPGVLAVEWVPLNTEYSDD
ncbi:MAG: MgtC/SapB family protein [Alphaproteobacteria bacterium]|nr:MgtC/SapB family protein [Alphaproteobacteria bacterium]